MTTQTSPPANTDVDLTDALHQALTSLVRRGYRLISPTGADVSHRLHGPIETVTAQRPDAGGSRRIGQWLYADGAWTPIEE